MEIIPDFFYPFKPFSILNFAMTEWLCHVTRFAKVFLLFFFVPKIFLLLYNTHQVRCYYFFIAEIIVESVNLI